MVKGFTHLSVCSNYSFKYGVNHPDQLVAKAAQLNMKSLALTDIDNLAGRSDLPKVVRAMASPQFLESILVLFKNNHGLPCLLKVGNYPRYID